MAVQVEEKKQRGRPKLSPQEKADRAAEREARKQDSGATPAPKKRQAKAGKKREPSKGHVVEDRRVHREDLTEDQDLCLLLQHAGKIRRQETRVKAERDELKKLRDLARSELGKAGLHEIKLLGSLESETGQEALREHVEMERRIARYGGCQVSIFEFTDADRTPSVDKAYHAGKVAGMAGSDCKAPEGMGMTQEQSFLQGWHDGQEVNRTLLLHMASPPAPTEADAFDAHAPDKEPTAESVFRVEVGSAESFRMKGAVARREGQPASVPDDVPEEHRDAWLDGHRDGWPLPHANAAEPATAH